MSTITIDQKKAIADMLVCMTLPSGLGDEHNACSVAAINLALSGRLSDDVPDCMSSVIGRWIIGVQDAMPDDLRNSGKWKDLLPLAAGTGKMHEAARLAIILDWMWGTVLPTLQPLAEESGFGPEWLQMTTERTIEAAEAARAAAGAAEAAAWAAAGARATQAMMARAWAASEAAGASAWAAGASAMMARAWAASEAAGASAWAAGASAWAAEAAGAEARADAWDRFDPCTLLQKLVEVSE